ncbi:MULTISPECIES: 4-amino-4-deoxy-L-arabinose transferase [Bradyrhizobium]|uniref:4-amino-4-deoxy-L-arabinose transferase n=1 Tax=Bradyrhizobium TaxID=374 RepID=UPI00155A22D3|nr:MULTISPECIES: 4-amino-4-deoxy-L-arabinose transferase [Bradyrhizobium]MCP1930615.1 hypothetical protein [Bradyrhizobium elkanii]MCS3517969.1 hypothetical protein [Bradyrhizobium elkanii]MCS3578765.1 hypothetical protein [Bradyrhizobium elkanii]MCS3690619.1 hypothetical protein [Bradyrhizobium elkanii]MCS3721638.1 hypothetical protein [Bradyrhizobium elkanii]
MTGTSTYAASGPAGAVDRSTARPLIALVTLALALRIPAAFWPNVIYPDEIFQYLEPAWRMLGHDSVVTWEWRDGIRGWFLPTLMAGPVALGDWIAPGGEAAFVVPRLVASCASLSIVISAWFFGARVSRTHAAIAAFVAAIWFEFIMLAPRTLGEPIATALILPAALLLTDRPSRRRIVIGGALLGLAFVCRFQYAPAIAILVIGAFRSHWRNVIPLVVGGVIALLVAAAIDAAHGAVPFGWLIANIKQNLILDRAASFGLHSPLGYFIRFIDVWSWAIVLFLAAIWRGRRNARLLLDVALVNLVFHVLIGHKEERFIFLSTVLLVILAALGSADWLQALRARHVWRAWAFPVVACGWLLLSLGLAGASSDTREYWTRGVGAARLAAELHGDAQRCGLALYRIRFQAFPGLQRLAGWAPLYLFHPKDPVAEGRLSAVLQAASPAFNRVIAREEAAGDLPPDYTKRSCAPVGDTDACIYIRSGSCDASAASRFVINDVLSRVDN